ncbi:MAG: hypothetical protein Q4A39_05075 [Eubacteriales bacterium]|nr:hypothetical protein [Eubacteriales bacterium]
MNETMNETTNETMEIKVLVCRPDGTQRIEMRTVPVDYFGKEEEAEVNGIDE